MTGRRRRGRHGTQCTVAQWHSAIGRDAEDTALPTTTESTSFTKDVQGRYLCNDISDVNAWKTAGGRPFDVIIVGGGTFGCAIAEHIWFRQKQAQTKPGTGLRTLVVEAGPYVLGEHVQNAGIQGFGDAAGVSILDDSAKQPQPPKNEVWGVPWKSDTPFSGLAYCVGGRSIYWGGWSPRLLPEELTDWPADLVAALNTHYFDAATRQIGVDETNDFIFGELHCALRQTLAAGLNTVTSAIPLDQLPASPILKGGEQRDDLLRMLGLDEAGAPSDAALKNFLKLEAPLAVRARPPHAGFFPLNKFSTVPLVMKAARTAYFDARGNDAAKEFMVLPNTHVHKIRTAPTATGGWRATGIESSADFLELAPNGVIVIATGTIESARLALNSFRDTAIPTLSHMGKNLLAHVRSNLTIRVPRSALAGLEGAASELQTSALFVKGRATSKRDGRILGTFHLQITASGGGATGGAEEELFKKIPDVEFFDALNSANDTFVAIAIRGIGQMAAADSANPDAHPSRVELDSARVDEYGVRRAFVTLTTQPDDLELWSAMDEAMDQVAKVFAGNQPFEVLFDGGARVPATAASDLSAISPYAPKSPQKPQNRRDGLGTTHHETGTLWMGDDPARSVTTAEGRFHHTENIYAAGPSLFPTIGSPNPMLTGIAVARRTGDDIVAPSYIPADGFVPLFDGQTLGDWRMSTIRNQPGRDNPGEFIIRGGVLEARTGTDLGLLWLDRPTPARYVLRLQWTLTAPDDNSGVFVGFPNPEGEGYDNTAWVGVNLGFEVQIDELARPDGASVHRTGAIYTFKGATDGPLVVRPIGEWNQYEITIDGADLTVALNDTVVNRFHFTGDPQSPRRGLAATAQEPRYIGLQTHSGRVLFRRIEWKAL